jgi:hypothetical protein
MVKDHVITVSGFFHDAVNFLPPGLLLSAAAGCVEHRQYWSSYVREFVGTILMIGFTFSAGKWIGQDSIAVAWSFHVMGVIAADYFGEKKENLIYCIMLDNPRFVGGRRSTKCVIHRRWGVIDILSMIHIRFYFGSVSSK